MLKEKLTPLYKSSKIISFFILFLLFLIACGKKNDAQEYEVTTVERGDISLSGARA